MKAQDPKRYYVTLLNAFVSAQDVTRKRQIVDSYPDLLSKEARDALNERMAEALREGNHGAAAAYSQNLILLDMWGGELQPH
jgi:hypothetical protein